LSKWRSLSGPQRSGCFRSEIQAAAFQSLRAASVTPARSAVSASWRY